MSGVVRYEWGGGAECGGGDSRPGKINAFRQ